MTVKWLKNKIACFAKIWKPLRQHFGFFEDWRKFGNPQKIGKCFKLGHTYFMLCVDRFITYKNKIGSSATQTYLIKLIKNYY